jgi:hypothetical protein
LLNSAQSSLRMVLQAFLIISMGRPVKEKRRVKPRGCRGTRHVQDSAWSLSSSVLNGQCLYQHTHSYRVCYDDKAASSMP